MLYSKGARPYASSSCKMGNLLLSLLALSCTLCSTRGALFAYFDEEYQVNELEVGEELQLTCKSTSKYIEFYVIGISPEVEKVENGSSHDGLFGSHPIVSTVSEFYDDSGHKMFKKLLQLTVIAQLNGTALQCGAKGVENETFVFWAYSRGILLRVEDDRKNSTSTVAPRSPYVDIGLVDHDDQKKGDVLHVECNSSSKYIAFCVVGASCDMDYIHGFPNGTNASLSDTLEYYDNEPGRTFYRRTLELSVVPELNMALQCKAGKDVQAYTVALLLKTENDVRPIPTGSESCPLPTETVKLKESDYPTCGGVTPTLKWSVLVLMEFILTLVCRF